MKSSTPFKMKTLCVDARMAFHSGIGTYIRNILHRLQSAPLKLYVLAPEVFTERWPELKNFNLIPVRSSIYSIREQIELPVHIPACDIFWSPHYNIPLLPIRAKKRVVSIHDVYHLAYGHTLNLQKRMYANFMLKRAVSLSDQIITVSQFSKNEIVKWTGASSDKITMIYNGVDRQLFSGSTSTPDNYFLFVSNLAPHKNLERLLEAWKIVNQTFPDWHLNVVGKHKVLQKPASQVRFLGEVNMKDLPGIYEKAFGLIAPSLYEGFGLTPLEAMAMRCPAIVSNCASFPEICKDAALYVDPFDVTGIANQIMQLIKTKELRDVLISRGLELVDHYSWDNTAAEHLDVCLRC